MRKGRWECPEAICFPRYHIPIIPQCASTTCADKRLGTSQNSARFGFFLLECRCQKLGGRSWVIPLACCVSPCKHDVLIQFLAEFVNKTRILTCILQHLNPKKILREFSSRKDSLPKYFITTNSAAKLSQGAVNRGEVLRTCFHLNFYTSIKSYILLNQISIQNTLFTCG